MIFLCFQKDAFLERCDVGEDITLRSICSENLLGEQVLAAQSSLSLPTNEDLFVAQLARAEPALFDSVCDIIFKQYDFRPPVTLYAETATRQNRQHSLQSMSGEKMECMLPGYWCQQTNVSSSRFFFRGLLSAFAVQRYSAVTAIKNAYCLCVCMFALFITHFQIKNQKS
ncbi:unnamed protein product [Gongylonema pulchrum]|uniref:Uncharacterized protein n=1 Tax=Gongylonema pulchrum TaxID=637853 RepID=A0A183EUI6_9BILA|nr:unnamed protein product [Gongylonema pulchrum]